MHDKNGKAKILRFLYLNIDEETILKLAISNTLCSQNHFLTKLKAFLHR